MIKFVFFVNKQVMTKKEYIEKLTNLIINRVRFHAPIVTDEEVDFALLEVVGIDPALPLFKFEKPLDSLFYAAFCKAKEEVEFNLLLTSKPLVSDRRIKEMKNTLVLLEEEMGSILHASIEALNINYRSHTKFTSEINEDYIALNGQKITLDYIPYYLYKKGSNSSVMYEISEFILNGKNFLLSLTNPYKQNRTLEFEINVILPRGYYIFHNDGESVEIQNLCNKDKAYFNYNLKGAKFNFSCVSGLESSTHACINLKLKIDLRPLEQKKLYFNYGENKYVFDSPREALNFFKMSQTKMNEIFDLQVQTKDKKFDDLFNRYIPQNIWLSWLKNTIDEESENFYLKTRENIAKNIDGSMQINEGFEGLKEVRFFRNLGWKRVFIVQSENRYLFANKVKYFNFTLLTKEIFSKNKEIYLSFGS